MYLTYINNNLFILNFQIFPQFAKVEFRQREKKASSFLIDILMWDGKILLFLFCFAASPEISNNSAVKYSRTAVK